MKVPLRYQMTEYDCGPTSLPNILSFLFEREEIPPEAVRNIMLFCLDSYGADGFKVSEWVEKHKDRRLQIT